MPKHGLRLDLEEYNHLVHHRYFAKMRKDLEARVRLRAILLVTPGRKPGERPPTTDSSTP